jgi:hypothetical protein
MSFSPSFNDARKKVCSMKTMKMLVRVAALSSIACLTGAFAAACDAQGSDDASDLRSALDDAQTEAQEDFGEGRACIEAFKSCTDAAEVCEATLRECIETAGGKFPGGWCHDGDHDGDHHGNHDGDQDDEGDDDQDGDDESDDQDPGDSSGGDESSAPAPMGHHHGGRDCRPHGGHHKHFMGREWMKEAMAACMPAAKECRNQAVDEAAKHACHDELKACVKAHIAAQFAEVCTGLQELCDAQTDKSPAAEKICAKIKERCDEGLPLQN